MDLKYIALMVDMAMHMMDIVQNSIRAEAKKICISFNEDSIGNRLIFRVEDDGIGMSGEAVKKNWPTLLFYSNHREELG